MSTRKDHCYLCGYTKDDAAFHMDHHLCKNDGNAPWQNESVPPKTEAAQEKKRPPIERECVKCAHQFKGSWQTPCPNCEVSPSPVATTEGDDLPFYHDSYVAGFLECKERAARIVDEHDGYLGRVMDLDPEFRDNRVENFTDSQIITTLRNLYEVASGLCDEPIPLSIRSEVERILAPEPKPTPQGLEKWWNEFRKNLPRGASPLRMASFYQIAEATWSAAQAPLLAKIAELELEVERLKRVEEFVGFTGRARAVLDRAKAAEARIAELESAQPKAEPVERLVSDETLKSFSTNFGVVSKIATELQQRRQREERRER